MLKRRTYSIFDRIQELPHTRWNSALVFIGLLYLSQGIPLYFFTLAIPTILRDKGVDLGSIGLWSLLAIPWALKFLWAPIVDRFWSVKIGQRRTWILPLQITMTFLLGSLYFFEPVADLYTLFGIGFAISLVSGTQDIAIDGYAVDHLTENNRSIGNGIQAMGSVVGTAIGGSFLLWVYNQNDFSHAVSYIFGISLVSLLVLAFLKENPIPSQLTQKPKSFYFSSFWIPGASSLILITLLFRISEGMVMGMINPFLIDSGWNPSEVGFTVGILGASVGLMAGIFSSFAHRKDPDILGKISVAKIAIYGSIAALTYYAPPNRSMVLTILFLSVIGLRYCVFVSLYSYFMGICRPGKGGSDFTVLICFDMVAYFGTCALASKFAAVFGYGAIFAMGTLVSGFAWMATWKTPKQPTEA